MKEFFNKKNMRIFAIILIVAVIIAAGAYFWGGEAGPLSDITGAISIPIQTAMSSVVGWFEDIYGYVYEYDNLLAEIESLRTQLAEAQEQLRHASEAIEENESLRELFNFQQKNSDFVFCSAKIVSWNASNWASSFTISKGSDSGLELDDCVVTEYGALVGQIYELGTTWAVVRTVIDVDTSIGVLVGDAGSSGMAIGDFTLMGQGAVKLTYLQDRVNLIRGDVVLTSGSGENVPQGLLVGTVASVENEAGGQTTYGIVEPACDLSLLTQVYIITDFDVIE